MESYREELRPATASSMRPCGSILDAMSTAYREVCMVHHLCSYQKLDGSLLIPVRIPDGENTVDAYVLKYNFTPL